MKCVKKISLNFVWVGIALIALTGCGKNSVSGTTSALTTAVGTTAAGFYSGCYPIAANTAIPVVISGATLNSANLLAASGQAGIGGTGQVNGTSLFTGQGSDASLQLGITPLTTATTYATTVSGQGILVITALRYQVMLQRLGYGTTYGYPTTTTPLCVTGMTVNLGVYGNRPYGGTLTLVMNNGQYSEELYF